MGVAAAAAAAAAAGKDRDRRQLSGRRVFSKCEVVVDAANPYAWNPVRRGYLVFNVRGGCLYLGERFDEKDIANMFPHDGRGTFVTLALRAADGSVVELDGIGARFRRIRKQADRDGIVFTFLNTSEEQLDTLLALTATLPAIGAREDGSVPLEEVTGLEDEDRLSLL